MADSTTAVPTHGAPRRGRGGRRGGSRRGHHNGQGRSNTAAEAEQNTQPGATPTQSRTEPTGISPGDAGGVNSPPAGFSGSGRNGRGRQGGGRRGRGGATQRSVVVSHRGGRGPPPAADRGGSALNGVGLRATAPTFTPGQPISSFSSEQQATPPARKPPAAPKEQPKSTAADLPTRIHEDIDHRQYECVICTNEVLRNSKVWSCSICWTVTHLHCVKKWHANAPSQSEGWRCPGCNSTLLESPGPYSCWCGKDPDPKSIAGLPPHTCGQTCSKPRATCPHQCSLMCHAGPCPPCTLMGPTQSCFCGKHTSTKRCSETDYGKGWSCQEPCGDLLACGEHECTKPCHSGLCDACEIPMLSTCYCGKEQREIACNRRDDVLESFNHGQSLVNQDSDSDNWFQGSFRCSNVCGRSFDCGHHTCEQPCHPQHEAAAHCPLSPDVIIRCPCGKTLLDALPAEPRQSCLDPVSHCDKPCNKVLACGHACPDTCHTGSCAPCTQHTDVTCRCGRTAARSACHQGHVEHPLCFRVCRAQLNCGRHECGERCCAGDKKAAERRRQKRSANEDYEPEHICLQLCGRQLKCGRHTCQQLCHKGPCMSCPEAIFDEISCSCGRTVLQPPQPCGTRPPECRFPCTRARPCGHPSVQHQCHPDDAPCPKCPFLVEKPCICGKKVLKNQPCWFAEARCGLPCGKKLKCGAHECRKPCHKPGECEDADIPGSHCSQLCCKIRKSCEHTCTDQCHAPYLCKEDKPCQSKTFITCPCQHRKQEVRCLATMLNPWPSRETALKCDDECLRLQRNRKLAEALNIDAETHTDDHIPYSDTTLKMFRDNLSWAQGQEREFRVFAAAADEKRLRFKPMPSHQRAFLHALAEDFGFDSESQDPEPHRHVCIFKTPRFVSAPQKTLAQCLRFAKTAATLGTGASLLKPTTPITTPPQESQSFNALLLTNPRFGLTIDELDTALATDLASASRSGPALTFTTRFLPSDEVLIHATPRTSAAGAATTLAATPQAVEAALASLKPAVARTVVARLGLAGAVALCHVDAASGNIARREGDAVASGGWSAVASRGAWRKVARPGQALAAAVQVGQMVRAPSAFVALRKLEARKKAVVAVEQRGGEGGGGVEEDWLAAVEREEKEEVGEDAAEDGSGSEVVVDEAADAVVVGDVGGETLETKEEKLEQADAESGSHAAGVEV